MSNVGDQLRTARENQRLTAQQVAEAINLRTDHVRALEAGDYNVFAAPVYIRGFVRQYAALVKLDPSKILADLDRELAEHDRFKQPPSLTGVPPGLLDHLMLRVSAVNWRIGLGLAAIAAIVLLTYGGCILWRRHTQSDPLSKVGPGFYEPAQTNQGEILPLPAQR